MPGIRFVLPLAAARWNSCLALLILSQQPGSEFPKQGSPWTSTQNLTPRTCPPAAPYSVFPSSTLRTVLTLAFLHLGDLWASSLGVFVPLDFWGIIPAPFSLLQAWYQAVRTATIQLFLS